ncbi:MAG: TIGR00730 family Rossman fold protein [Egibacteraceae bacterium]
MSSLAVCVYCASSDGVPAHYRTVAADLGRALAAEDWSLVYGGGNVGLMGEVARAALAAGAHVTGVIPHLLADREVALEEVTELIRTETLRDRKRLMDERSDAFIVLPGGIGTLEELVEIVTLKQLGYHDRAVVLLDSAGYWDPVVAQLHRMVDEGFAAPELLQLVDVADDVAEAVVAIRRYRPRTGAATEQRVVETAESPRDGTEPWRVASGEG